MTPPDGRTTHLTGARVPDRRGGRYAHHRLGSPREVHDERDILVNCGRGS
jgi:hypothetical protein